MTRALLAASLFMIAFAGCVGQDQISDADGVGLADTTEAPKEDPVVREEPSATGARQEVTKGIFAWTASASAPGLPASIGVASSNNLHFEVGAGATQLELLADWSCLTPLCPIHLYLYAPGASPPALATQEQSATEGPVTMTVADPEPGEWHVIASSDGATVHVNGAFEALVTY